MMINRKFLLYTFAILYASSFGSLSAQIAGNVQLLPDTLSTSGNSVSEPAVSYFTTHDPAVVTERDYNDFNKGFIISPYEAIIGKLPGLLISNDNPYPGSDFTITTLHNTSLYYSNSPLIVADDIPLTNTMLNISPLDIDNITFIREGADACLFGSQGLNGVLDFRTREGSDKLEVTYTGRLAISSVQKKYDIFSSDEFRNVVNEAYSDDPDVTSLLGDADTDWQDQIFRVGLSNSHNLSISGAPFKIPVRLSIGKTFQNGVIKTSSLNRTTLSLSVSPYLFDDHLKISIKTNGIFDKNRMIDENLVGYALRSDPTQPVYSNNDKYGGYLTTGWSPNPVAVLNLSDFRMDMDQWIASFKVDYEFHFLPGMHAVFNYGIDNYRNYNHNLTDTAASWAYPYGQGEVLDYNLTVKHGIIGFNLNYSRELNSINSEIEVMAGWSSQESRSDFYHYSASLLNPSYIHDKSTSWYESSLSSFFGSFAYIFKDRYSMHLSIRDDGDSHYSTDDRWILYPALSLEWNIKKEPFLSSSGAFNELKLHAAYGLSGAFEPTSLPETMQMHLNREVTSYLNGGIDFSVLGGRLSGYLMSYSNIRYNIIALISVPAGTSLNNMIPLNIAESSNKGIELSLAATVLSRHDLTWYLKYWTSLQKSTILDMRGGGDYITGFVPFTLEAPIIVQREGYPVNSFITYQQVYDENGKPIEGLYADRSGNGTVNSADRYLYKKTSPDVLMGISSFFNYKNWELSFSGRLSLGNYEYNTESSQSYYDAIHSSGLQNISRSVLSSGFQSYNPFSDYFIENASFFKMDYISLSYEFEKLVNGSTDLTVAATIQNAFTVTKFSGYDPEMSSGILAYSYPRARTFCLEVRLAF